MRASISIRLENTTDEEAIKVKQAVQELLKKIAPKAAVEMYTSG